MKNAIIILNYNDSENTKLLVQDIKNYKVLFDELIKFKNTLFYKQYDV